jgi:O-antigen/teichoic acid export membrane protein
LKSVDLTTPAGRAHDRQRRILYSALASGFARGISVLTLFITVPVALAYLGQERYGVWVMITSLTLGLSLVDLGLGNGLINAIAEAHGRDEPALAQRYISSAFFLLTGISLSFGLVFLIVQGFVPWPRVFNVITPAAAREAGPAVAVFVACLVIAAPLSVAQRVQTGFQRGFDNSLWQAAGSLFGLAGLLIAVGLGMSLPWMVFAVAGLPLLTAALQAGVLFGWRHRELRPNWRSFSIAAAARIFKLGGLFFVLQVAAALAFASDNLVAAHVLGAELVAEYSVTMQLFSLPALVLGTLFMPLWPAYGEAVTRGDFNWVSQTLKRSLLLAIVVAGLPSGEGRLFSGGREVRSPLRCSSCWDSGPGRFSKRPETPSPCS